MKLFLIMFFSVFSLFSQTGEPAKEEKKEITNREIMEENASVIEKERAEKEKAPETGYDAQTNSKKAVKESNDRNGNFWVLGGSIGSPSGGNFVAGYYFKDLVLRVSGMNYSPHWNGIQGDIGYSFWKTPVIAHSISAVFGNMHMRPFNPQLQQGGQNKYERDGIIGYNHDPATASDTLIRTYIAQQNPDLALFLDYRYRTRQYANFHQQYVGLTYDILVGGFFLQLGMGFGQGSYRDPQLLMQMGYLFDFGRN